MTIASAVAGSLARSVGSGVTGGDQPTVLKAVRGWTDGVACSGGSLFAVLFSREVVFTNHLGVKFINLSTADTGTVISATVSPANRIEYTVAWGSAPPVQGNLIQFIYESGVGNYADDKAVPMQNDELTIINCTGDELVTNGDFEDGATGWTGMNVTGGVANTIATTGSQVINTVAGMSYEVTLECDAKGVSPQSQIQNGAVTGSPVLSEVNPSGNGVMKPYSMTFVAGGSDSIIVISNGSNTALWDNFSVRLI